MRRKLLSLVVCVALWGCGYDSFDDYDTPQPTVPSPTTTIAELNALYTGEPVTVNREVIVQGYVNSTDRGNNFFKSFVIQDHSASIEIMAGLYNLHNIYPPGSHIILSAHGLTLGSHNSMIQIGITNRSSSAAEVDYIGHRRIVDQYVTRDLLTGSVVPMVVDLRSLSSDHCGKLVTVNNIKLISELPSPTWAENEFSSTTYNKFADSYGNTIFVVCSAYANFAKREIPRGNLSITGILYCGTVAGKKKAYILKPGEIADVVAL